MKPVKTATVDVPQGDIHDYNSILKYFNDEPVKQSKKDHYHSITFVTTGIIAYDGGQTTMLHLGTLLSKQGYHVYYLSYVPQTVDEMEQNAEFNYEGYEGTCVDMSQLDKHNSDIWLATLWESAYVIKNKPGYKMYFVQDYEPYFYPFGDRYQLAKKTYELGLHMVSLGPWCAKMIKENCKVNSPIDEINFPVNLEQYPYQAHDLSKYPDKKVIDVAVYTKWSSPRRAPINIQMTLNNCQNILAKQGLKLNLHYFGTDKKAQFINGENLGKLTKPEMISLYNRCDFGIAPSMTNFSLVPFEMMSCGLPLIDFKEGTGSYFLPEGAYLKTGFNEKDLAKTFLQAKQNPLELEHMVQKGVDHLQSITWKQTLTDFEAIIEKISAAVA
ncbi:Glycosyltransferase [Pediococcus damnosus]|uniref:Glycosyltransferase n=1 Tax=Pediococcus damnosus TaxID=51663 RepID=A0ABM6A3Z4_9LACO|nr:glycosyltransferase [Pediococcus damnosus]AMV66995.1 Glycosyltransferase [Pediococcus damnosus]